MLALLKGLPPEAAVWRASALPPAEEYAALLVERQDMWWHTWIGLRTGKRVAVPAPLHIVRPGDEERAAEQRKVETDPARIAELFRKHVSN